MSDLRTQCATLLATALTEFAKAKNIDLTITAKDLTIETPPNPEMGDLGIPMFPFAKAFRMAPPIIAKEVAALIIDNDAGIFLAVGPYVNVKLNKENKKEDIK